VVEALFSHPRSRSISRTFQPAQVCSVLASWGSPSPHSAARRRRTSWASSSVVLTSPRAIARHSADPTASSSRLRLGHGTGQTLTASRSLAIAQRWARLVSWGRESVWLKVLNPWV